MSKRNKEENKEFELFDDCAICQAMKQAEEERRDLNMEELQEAFVKAQEQGGIVADG